MQEKAIMYFHKALPYIITYRYLLIGVALVSVFSFALFRIDSTLNTERDENKFNQQLAEIDAVTFDEEAIAEIRNLESTGVNIRPQLPGNRVNPF